MWKKPPSLRKYPTTHPLTGIVGFLLSPYSENNHNHNSFILGDKRSYLSLPRPGVSIPPPALVNVPAADPLTHAAPCPTEAPAQQPEACQSRQAGCRGIRRPQPTGVQHHAPQLIP